MPTKRYALERQGPPRLELSWETFWKNFTVRLDGNVVGTVEGQKELRAGQTFPLPDGSTLQVKLVQKFTAVDLEVLRNGTPLPGSASDPDPRLKIACGVVFFIAGLNIILGLLGVLIQSEFLQALGLGLGSVILGLAFLVLGYFAQRRSALALTIAVILFALDGILGLILAAAAGGSPSMAGVIVRIALLIPMIQGIGAAKALKQQGAAAQA